MTALATGHSTAVAHGEATWQPTSRFIAERLERIDRAARQLRTLGAYCDPKETLQVLECLLQEANDALRTVVSPELPFLVNTTGMPHRLRVAHVMREWLLSTCHPREPGHLKDFLLGYQEVSPLYLAEIRLLPLALKLAVADKCHLLPAPENSLHVQLLPRLLQRLGETCAFITQTDWDALGEAISRVHLLLRQDPTQTYDRLDFPARDACRRSVEELSRIFRTSESDTVRNAIALAERKASPVGSILLGPERAQLIESLITGRRAFQTISINGNARRDNP